VLCLIWGSSFMLMKWGMFDKDNTPTLSAYDVAALRILFAGIVMLPFVPSSIKKIPSKDFVYVLLSGWLGSFFPAFLFCIAESKIDGSLAGSLNALTSLFVIITGFLFFNVKSNRKKIIGVIIGLLGCTLITVANYSKPFEYIAYSGFVILATFMYGFNINLIQKKLSALNALSVAAISLTGLIIPSATVLFFSGYFSLPLSQHSYIISTVSSVVLGILGTSLATILFYVLIKRAGGLFASLVTYGIPFVAIGWGFYNNELITEMHILALVVILVGVYIVNQKDFSKKLKE